MSSGVIDVRSAEAVDIGRLAEIWHAGWHDAHARIVPAELTQLRTLESFLPRIQTALENMRVVGTLGEPVGFCMLKDDELYQLYVSAQARGTGIAAALVADAEARLAERGVETAWLACAVGNERAARFYEKCGWHRAATVINDAEIVGGTFPVEVWRYEKQLSQQAPKPPH